MKLDHIGDLITALPALRRLRQHFPTARIYLLASGAAKAFLVGDDCIDEVIEFEFFHARSGLGQKDIAEEDLLALGSRLAPYRFDVAMDLRKQLENSARSEIRANTVPGRLRLPRAVSLAGCCAAVGRRPPTAAQKEPYQR